MHLPPRRPRPTVRLLTVGFAAAALALGVACTQEEGGDAPARPAAAPPARPAPDAAPAAKPAPKELTHEELVAQGRSVYMANCIACHSQDPTLDGALGPAVAGSSLALIEARVMRGEYPPDYTPKRDTRVMIPLPHLKDQLPALAAYLDSFPE